MRIMAVLLNSSNTTDTRNNNDNKSNGSNNIGFAVVLSPKLYTLNSNRASRTGLPVADTCWRCRTVLYSIYLQGERRPTTWLHGLEMELVGCYAT